MNAVRNTTATASELISVAPWRGAFDRVSHRVSWGVNDAVLWLVVSLIAPVLAFVALQNIRYNGETPQRWLPTEFLALQSALWLPLVLGPTMTSRRSGKGPYRDFGLAWQPRFAVPWFVGGVVFQVVAIRVLYFFIDLVVEVDPSSAAKELAAGFVTRADWAVLGFSVVIAAPFVEEFFYRGLLQTSLERRLGPAVGIVGSAFVFAVVHFQGYQLPGLFAVGLVTGWLARRSGTVTTPAAFHAGFNGAGFVMLYLEYGPTS